MMPGKTEIRHIPVLLTEVLAGIQVQPGGRYIDATCGEGGHSQSILQATGDSGQLLSLDLDMEALSVAKDRVDAPPGRFITVNANFSKIRTVAMEHDMVPVHGILFDLGISSLQLDKECRGFSFRRDDPLDMRFSPNQELTAADILNFYTKRDIENILFSFGEEPAARRIASAIVDNRPLKTTFDLVNLVTGQKRGRRSNIHPATRTFQALRIAVNDELANLSEALENAVSILGYSGRIVVISYHSLEDRIVKSFFRRQSSDCLCPPRMPQCNCGHKATLKLISRGTIKPSAAEISVNRRSRSAKMRIAERI